MEMWTTDIHKRVLFHCTWSRCPSRTIRMKRTYEGDLLYYIMFYCTLCNQIRLSWKISYIIYIYIHRSCTAEWLHEAIYSTRAFKIPISPQKDLSSNHGQIVSTYFKIFKPLNGQNICWFQTQVFYFPRRSGACCHVQTIGATGQIHKNRSSSLSASNKIKWHPCCVFLR